MKFKKILFGVLAIAASALLSVGVAACKDKDESSSVGASGSVASSIIHNSSDTQNGGATSGSSDDKKNDNTFDASDYQTTCVVYTISEDGLSVSVTDYIHFSANVSLLEKIKILPIYQGLPVTSIDDSAFYACVGLTSIEIPDSVTSIGEYAFSWCSNLTSVEIPDSVTSIGKSAFYECSGLTSVIIGNSVTSIGEGVFSGCRSLMSVYYNGIIDDWAQISFDGWYANPLYYADSLYIDNELVTEANITTVTKITGYAFGWCSSLTSVVIGNSVTSIGEGAFSGCSSLTSVYHNGTIDDWAQISFDGGSANPLAYADSLYIDNELVTEAKIITTTKISDYAFSGYSSLRSVVIGDSVTSIGEAAFSGCSNLTSVVIPDSVTSIGLNAFENCSSLTIYCEAASQPSGWNSSWGGYYSSCPVVWDCNNNEVADDGYIYTT